MDNAQQNAVQAVVFDLDGVLMDSEWLGFKGWCQWVEDHGGVLPEASFPGMTGLTAEETARYVMERSGLNFDVAESCAWVWQWLIDRFQDTVHPMPGAVDLVRGLAERGYPLAIASNSIEAYIDDALAGLGLADYFPVRVSIEQVAQGKPAPDVYLRAARLLGIPPARCLAVEDSRVGLQAAVRAGMRVIAVPGMHDRADGFHGAWRVYRSLEKVTEGLDSIL